MASFVRRRHTATSRGMLQPLRCRTYNDNVRCIYRGVGFAGGGQFSLLRGRRTSPATTVPTRRPPPPPPALDQRRARLVQHQAAGAVEPLPHSPARFAPAPETEALQQGVRRTCCVGRGPPPDKARPPPRSASSSRRCGTITPTRWSDSHPPRWTGALQKGVIRTRWPDELEVPPTNRFAHAATGRAVLYCMSSIGARIYVRVAALVSATRWAAAHNVFGYPGWDVRACGHARRRCGQTVSGR